MLVLGISQHLASSRVCNIYVYTYICIYTYMYMYTYTYTYTCGCSFWGFLSSALPRATAREARELFLIFVGLTLLGDVRESCEFYRMLLRRKGRGRRGDGGKDGGGKVGGARALGCAGVGVWDGHGGGCMAGRAPGKYTQPWSALKISVKQQLPETSTAHLRSEGCPILSIQHLES